MSIRTERAVRLSDRDPEVSRRHSIFERGEGPNGRKAL